MTTKGNVKTRRKHPKTPEQVDLEKNTKADEGKPTKPRHYRKAAQEQIEKQYRQIVAKLATEATKGSVRHTKLLFDLGGVQEEVQSSSSRRRKSPSLGKILLREAEALKRNKEALASAIDEGK